MKKQLLKKMFALLLAGTMVMGLVACGGDDAQEPENTEQESEQEQEEEEPEESEEQEEQDEPENVEEDTQEQEEPQEPEEPVVTDGFVYSGEALAEAARPVYNNDMNDDYSKEAVTDTGVEYTFEATDAIKGIVLENLTVNPQEYNTITCRIRSLSAEGFSRWRFYLHSDLGGNLETYKDETQTKEDYFIEILSDGTGTNIDFFHISEPDADGWITVTFDVGNLNYWKNASVIDGFRIGWVNLGAGQEVGEVILSMQ